MSLPDKCLVDTNVPKTANLAAQPDPNSDMPDEAYCHVSKRLSTLFKSVD